MSNIRTSSQPKIICQICSKAYIHNGNYIKHIKTRHPEEASEMLEEHVRSNMEVDDMDIDDTDNDDLPPAGTPILVTTIEYHTDGPQPVDDNVVMVEGCRRSRYPNPYTPFLDEHEFEFAFRLVKHGISRMAIDDIMTLHTIKSNLPKGHFKSAYTLYNKIRDIEPDGIGQHWVLSKIDYDAENLETPYFWRDPMKVVEDLLQNPSYLDDLIYTPCKLTGKFGERIYGELHTGDWWWKLQTKYPQKTIIPLIFGSDATHLTNFSGDKKAWPLYLTIGNLPASIRSSPNSLAMVPIALLPVFPKKKDDKTQERYHHGMQDVLRRILQKFQSASINGREIVCADGRLRICHPIACAWLADHPEKMSLLGLNLNSCSYCEVPPDHLGEYGEEYTIRDHTKYRQIIREEDIGNPRLEQEEKDQCIERITSNTGLKIFPLAIWKLKDVNCHELFAPDTLHCIWIGVFSHLMGWVMGFLKKHKRSDLFNHAWLACTEYPNFRKPVKVFSAVKKWMGFENRNSGRILLPCLAVALKNPGPGQTHDFRKALRCVRNFVDFSLLCQFRIHTNRTIGYMRRYLDDFHETKDIFLEFRAHKKVKAQATKIGNLTRAEIANLDGPSRERAMTAAQIREQAKAAEIDALKEKSNFNFPKMHYLEHLPEHISSYGYLGQYSTEVSERAHKKLIKEGWKKSNHVDAMAQILKYGDTYRSMMKMKAEIELATTKPEPARQTEYPRFCGRRVKRYRNVGDLSRQIEVPQLKTLLTGYLNLNEDVIRHCRIRVWKSLEIKAELMPWQEYQVETIQRIRCTVKEAWRRNRPKRQDAVWVKQRRGISDDHYRALHGRKPAFVEAFFQVDCEDTSRRNLALVRTLNPVDSGYVDPDEGLPWVEIPLTGPKYEIIDIDQISGAAQLVPLNPGSEAGTQFVEGDSRRWVVNSRIDLNSFGWIYYDEDEQHDDMERRRR